MKIKKIIAREFLYFLGSLLFLVVVYACFILYNVFQENKIAKFGNDLDILNKQYQIFLSRPLQVKNPNITQEKLDDLANFIIKNPNVTKKNIYDIIIEIENDSILLNAIYDYAATTQAHKYKNKKEQNLKFPEFFVIKKNDMDSIMFFQSKIEPLQNDEAKSKDNILSSSETNNYILTIGLWVFIFSFGLRYLVYATKWSLQNVSS